MSELKRISVDFNTLTSAPEGIIKIAGPKSIRKLPPLEQGERVLLWEPGLEAEGMILLQDGWVLAIPDEATYKDTPLDEKYLRELPPEMLKRRPGEGSVRDR